MTISVRPQRQHSVRPPLEAPVDLAAEQESSGPDTPFAGGAGDALDPDLRHRLVSEAAYRRYVERNFEDGHDLDDWLEAEAEVDHLNLNPVSAVRS